MKMKIVRWAARHMLPAVFDAIVEELRERAKSTENKVDDIAVNSIESAFSQIEDLL